MTSDHLTLLGFASTAACGPQYAASGRWPWLLLLVNVGLALSGLMSPLGAAVFLATVGAVAGLVGEERWREVPLEALAVPGGDPRPPDPLGASTAS